VDENLLSALIKLWKTDIPSKVNVFEWRLLLNRLPTMAALFHRGVLVNPHDISCVFCLLNVEDTTHLFFSCYYECGRMF
jgi:hypothetical protein